VRIGWIAKPDRSNSPSHIPSAHFMWHYSALADVPDKRHDQFTAQQFRAAVLMVFRSTNAK
jgi:hypothetical protein